MKTTMFVNEGAPPVIRTVIPPEVFLAKLAQKRKAEAKVAIVQNDPSEYLFPLDAFTTSLLGIERQTAVIIHQQVLFSTFLFQSFFLPVLLLMTHPVRRTPSKPRLRLLHSA